MIKSTFKDNLFLGVLKWVTVHSQTEKCVQIISTPLDWKGKHARVFQIALQGQEENLPSQRENGKFWWREGLFHRVVKIFLEVILTI